jgi:hypothetical protein
MKANSFIISSALILSSITLCAQNAPGIETSLSRIEQGTFDTHQMLMGRKIPDEGTKGDYYLNPHWQDGFITLKTGQTFQKYPLKYDIENDMLEIKASNEVKILRGERVASFTWLETDRQQETQYINSHEYKLEGTPLIGFFELVVDGQVQLLCKTIAVVKDPTYVEGFDVGKRYSEITKKEVYYLSDESKVLTEIKSKKDVLEFMGDEGGVKQYMKAQKLGVSDKEDLAIIATFINQQKK